MLQGNNTEQSDPGNRSVGGFSVIDSAKRILEKFCPRTVSCADIIALAARDAVEIVSSTSLHGWHCSMAYWQDTSFGTVINLKGTWEQAGEPRTMIPTGRRDGMVSVASNVRPNIVDTSFSMDEMVKLFASKGLSLLDLVILSGAYSVSKAQIVVTCNFQENGFI